MEQFDDIRPYSDTDVAPVLQRLIKNQDLLKILTKHKYELLSRYFAKPMQWLTSLVLRRQLKNIKTIPEFQSVVAQYLTKAIQTTTSKTTFSGIEALSADQAYLFISNHRDIVLDSALANYAIHKYAMDTCHVAIGDNLLQSEFVHDLMRLNKSFSVKRSIQGRREKMNALKHLSAYINHCLENQKSIWIAQREGRAKDGNDSTDAAVIKMLNLHAREANIPFSTSVKRMHIVPIAVSYEIEPCGYSKVSELFAKQQIGNYQKKEEEDLINMIHGIKAFKGHVHIAFGKPLSGDYTDGQQVASAIDQQIYNNYYLHPNNFFAWELCYDYELFADIKLKIPSLNELFDVDLTHKRKKFADMVANCKKEYRWLFIQMYAYPIVNHYSSHNLNLK